MAIVVNRPKLSFLENLYFPGIIKGLIIYGEGSRQTPRTFPVDSPGFIAGVGG